MRVDDPGRVSSRTRFDVDCAVELAAQWLAAGRRIDMQSFADELGVTRMTLHRHVGGRERLIGEAVWHLSEKLWRDRLERVERQGVAEGDLVCVPVITLLNEELEKASQIKHLLATESELALRLFTDPDGPIEPRSVALTAELIAIDEEAGRLEPIIDRDSLAYALVKLAEAYLCSAVMAGHPTTVQDLTKIQTTLLRAGQVTPPKAS